MPDDEMLYINGIDAETGDYLVDPMTIEEAASYARGEPHDSPLARLFSWLTRQLRRRHLAEGLSKEELSDVGWAVVFHRDEGDEVREALEPLLEQRKNQVGEETLVKTLEYDGAQDAHDWLRDHGVLRGDIEPWNVPYYLLLVGSPQRMPFRFGRLLQTQYAVGRIHFDDAAGYACYVQSVLDYETGAEPPNAKEAVFFGTRHTWDKATQLSADLLLDPLADGLPPQDGDPALPAVAALRGFSSRKLRADDATREALCGILAPPADSKPPAFLFTATHGMGYRRPHPNQAALHGALLCQDWSGIGSWRAEHCFTAQDLPANARVHGLIAFLFACYSGGTPTHDQYMHRPGSPPPQIANNAFYAALPRALLAHPGGGSLACIGHLERTWSSSFVLRGRPALGRFSHALAQILGGQPVGYAMQAFGRAFSFLSADLTELQAQARIGTEVPDEKMARYWSQRNDAGGYVILGDPAVRLRVDELVHPENRAIVVGDGIP